MEYAVCNMQYVVCSRRSGGGSSGSCNGSGSGTCGESGSGSGGGSSHRRRRCRPLYCMSEANDVNRLIATSTLTNTGQTYPPARGNFGTLDQEADTLKIMWAPDADKAPRRPQVF